VNQDTAVGESALARDREVPQEGFAEGDLGDVAAAGLAASH
jgi:hypothetical protein